MRKGRYDAAQAAFAHLDIHASVADIERTARELEAADQQQERQRRRRWTPGVKRALMVVSGFFIFQQITGINVPLYYGPHLLGPLFGSGGKVGSTISGVEVTAIMTAVNVTATYLAFRWIDRLGRRKLAIGGYSGMALAAVLTAAGLGLLAGLWQIVVVMIGMAVFIASFAVGVGGTGWLIQGEVFPTAVRGQAAAVGAAVDWLANFALIEVFPTWQGAIGLGWVMICFAGLCLLAVLFVSAFLPETKGHSVEEITRIFDRQAAGGRRATAQAA